MPGNPNRPTSPPDKFSKGPETFGDGSTWHDSFMRRSIDKEKFDEGYEAIFGKKKFKGRKGTYRGAGSFSDLEEADRPSDHDPKDDDTRGARPGEGHS